MKSVVIAVCHQQSLKIINLLGGYLRHISIATIQSSFSSTNAFYLPSTIFEEQIGKIANEV
jgi:hypothetical protein